MKTKSTRKTTMFLAVCTAIAAAVAGLNSVWQAAIFVAIAGALAAAGLELHRHKNLRVVKVLAWIAAATVFWFASVDRFATIEFCQRCPIHHFQYDYRFLGISVCVTKIDEHDALVSLIATDLGRPCLHVYNGFPLARRWGLFYYSGYSSCLCCLSGDEELNQELRQQIMLQSKTDPDLKDEFYNRVVVERDWKYLHSFAPPADQAAAKTTGETGEH